MVGIDIIELSEFKKQLEKGGEIFLDRAFSRSEHQGRTAESLAGIFCAKEAVMKAIGIEPGGWRRIEIRHEPSGKPFALAEGRRLQISISHNQNYAVAVALDL